MANKGFAWDSRTWSPVGDWNPGLGVYEESSPWLFDALAIFPSKIKEHMLYPWLFDGFHVFLFVGGILWMLIPAPGLYREGESEGERERERIAWCEGWFLDSFVKGDGNFFRGVFQDRYPKSSSFSRDVIFQAWHISLVVIWIIDSWRFLFQTISRPVPAGSSHV